MGAKNTLSLIVTSGGSTLFSLPLYRCQRPSHCWKWWKHSLVLSLSLSCCQWKWKQKIIYLPQPSLLSPSQLSSMAAKNNLSLVVASGSSSNLSLLMHRFESLSLHVSWRVASAQISLSSWASNAVLNKKWSWPITLQLLLVSRFIQATLRVISVYSASRITTRRLGPR